MSETVRYTLLLDAKANSNVEDLQRRYGLRSKAAVFDLAATLLLWVSEQQAQGFRVGRSDGTTFAEVLLPTLAKPSLDATVSKSAAPAKPVRNSIKTPARAIAKRRSHLTAVDQQTATTR